MTNSMIRWTLFATGLIPSLLGASKALASGAAAAVPAAAPAAAAPCKAVTAPAINGKTPAAANRIASQFDSIRSIEHDPACFNAVIQRSRNAVIALVPDQSAGKAYTALSHHLDALAKLPLPYDTAKKTVNVNYVEQFQTFLNAHDTEPPYHLLQIGISDIVAAFDSLDPNASDTADNRKQLDDLKVHLEVLRDNADPYLFHLDSYTAIEYSNLFRDRTTDTSFFGTGKPFYVFEANQLTTIFGQKYPLTYCIAATFRPTPIANPLPDVIASSASVAGEIGGILWAFGDPTGSPGDSAHTFTLGIHVGLGMEALPRTPATGTQTDESDKLLGMSRGTFVYRATRGVWQGTNLEIGYAHDPRFIHSERLIAILRVVLTPNVAGSVGKGLGAFVEVAGNRSLTGRGTGETRLMAGVRIDTLSILRAVIGASAESSPSSQ